jgi:hypothetical protein
MTPMKFAAEAAKAALQLYGIDVSELQADTVARGVLLAMREPSGEMLGEAHDTVLYSVKGEELEVARNVWQRMLVAALDESAPSS